MFMSNHGSLREHKTYMDASTSSTSSCGFRGCFRTSGSRSNNGHECQHLVQQEGGEGSRRQATWWKKKLNEAKNRLCRNKKQKKATSYDIDSYPLNFDEVVGREADAALGFAARFADPFTNEESSIGREVRRTDESAFVESRG